MSTREAEGMGGVAVWSFKSKATKENSIDLWCAWNGVHEEVDQVKRFESSCKAKCTPESIDYDCCLGMFNGSSGNYVTTLTECECIDFRRRKQPCKHMYRLAIEIGIIEAEVKVGKNKPFEQNPAIHIDDDKSDDFSYRLKSQNELKIALSQRAIILDTETTGMTINAYSGITHDQEMLQLSIIDENGNVLFDEYFKPAFRKRWSEAEGINGISSAMLKDKLPFSSFLDAVQSILDAYDTIVMYNANFDVEFLRASGCRVEDQKVLCAMREIARARRVSIANLQKCALELGFSDFEAHNALGDSLATLHIYNSLKRIELQ